MSARLAKVACMVVAELCVGILMPAKAGNPMAVLFSDPFNDPLNVMPARLVNDSACDSPQVPGGSLDLETAVDLALCNNPQIKASWAEVKAQASELGISRAAYLPTLSVNLSSLNTRTNYDDVGPPATSVRGNTVYASLAWRVLDFGQRAATEKSSQALLQAALASHDASIQKILNATVSAYFDVQTAAATWQSRQRSEATAAETLESIRRREANGLAAHGDVLQAAAAVARAALNQSRAQGSYHKAVAILAYTLGLDPGTPLVLPVLSTEKVITDGDDVGGPLAAWLDEVVVSHPEIRALQAQRLASVERIRATRAEGLPTVDFSINSYKNGYPGQGLSALSSRVTTIGVALNIPIFDGYAHTYRVRKAEAQAEQTLQQLADIQHIVREEVVKVYADVVSASANLQAAGRLLNATRDTLASAQRRYRGGAADIVEILNAQTALAEAELESVSSHAEWRSAHFQLLITSGKFDVTRLH
ncbi:TolC family protein [Duganella sp. FT109W]|uniref:Protein CyaE n=1 Tax=Duganella margarita TaxID=2692170 RepID=A0ABW9WGW5_9BURK|nr:TolC family protein [Duganella margarita]MYN40372.1 TolC family protein [Duganella margarita]